MSTDEFVSHAMNRAKVHGAGRILFQLLSELENVIVHGTSGRVVLIAPHFIEQFVTADNPVRILHQELEGFEFLSCQDDDAAIALDFHLLEVDRYIIEGYNVSGFRANRMT